jgi:RimJ/RimL family protein N-acetyltransferase
MTQPTLTTERLELVPLADEHLEFDSDPEVLRYLAARASTPAEVEAAHRRRMAAATSGLGFWVGTVDGEPVGWWILRPPNGPWQQGAPAEAELGYRLLRSWWRRGLASEGSRELIRHGFEDAGLGRIFAQTLTVNEGSRAVMASLGMSYLRVFPVAPDDADIPGADQGEVEYVLTREDWEDRP